MTRVKRGVVARRRHKKIMKQAKGYYGARSRVDDDLRRFLGWREFQILKSRHERDLGTNIKGRHHANRRSVHRNRGLRTERLVDPVR